MSKAKKTCNHCKRSIAPAQFYNSNSPLFSDGKIPFCKSCLREMMPENDIDAVKTVLRQIDKPFLSDIWNTSKESTNHTIGDYFRTINSLQQYRDLTWADSIHYDEDKNISKLVDDTRNTKINSDDYNSLDEVDTEHGAIKVTKELKSKWGNFSNREIIEMEKMYLDMDRANDISTPQHKRQLFFYCKLNVLMDKALEENDFSGYEKLSRQFENLTKNSGFRPIDRKDGSEASGIRSFSQIYAEIEKDGWIEPYDISESQDIVDRSLQYLINYQRKLLNSEQLHTPPEDTPKVGEE